MINNSKFIERLQKVMHHYQLSAATFADDIKVQRSSISHLLSGRNKPSLDFVLKVLARYETVDLYWLLNGKGSFPKKEHTHRATEPTIENAPALLHTQGDRTPDKAIDRIIIFYKDGTFKNYTP